MHKLHLDGYMIISRCGWKLHNIHYRLSMQWMMLQTSCKLDFADSVPICYQKWFIYYGYTAVIWWCVQSLLLEIERWPLLEGPKCFISIDSEWSQLVLGKLSTLEKLSVFLRVCYYSRISSCLFASSQKLRTLTHFYDHKVIHDNAILSLILYSILRCMWWQPYSHSLVISESTLCWF